MYSAETWALKRRSMTDSGDEGFLDASNVDTEGYVV